MIQYKLNGSKQTGQVTKRKTEDVFDNLFAFPIKVAVVISHVRIKSH